MKKGKIEESTLSVLFSDISLMISSGDTMEEIISMLLSENTDPEMGETLRAVHTSLSEGNSLSEAMSATGRFPSYALRMLSAAEDAGRMENTTAALGQYYERVSQLFAQVRNAVLQPMTLLGLLAAILGCFVAVVLPILSRVYTAMGGGASGYITTAYVISAIAFIMIIAVLAAVILIWKRVRSGRVSEKLRALWHSSRLTRGAAEILTQAQFMNDVETRIGGGLMPDQSFTIAAESVEDPAYQEKALRCARRLAEGGSLGTVVYEEEMLPAQCGRILYSGCKSGHTSEAAKRVTQELFTEAELRLRMLVDQAEPILTGVFTLAVGASLLSVLLPLISVISALG